MTNALEERYEGNFLDALDLPEGKLVAVVIEAVAEPNTERDSAKKPIKNAILSFKGKSKRLVINKTNYKNLKAMFGRDPEAWLGKTVNIQRRYLDGAHGFGVNNTLCIRIVPPVGTPILKSAANFMGQPHPYGDVPQQQVMPAQEKLKQPAPDPPAETPTDKVLREWLTAVEALKSVEGGDEFHTTLLPTVPKEIKQQVVDAWALKMAKLRTRTPE